LAYDKDLKKMRKILYINRTRLSDEERRKRTKLLSELASEGSQINIAVEESPVESIESEYEGSLTVPDACRIAVEAEKQGYDALISGCAGDPGLGAIRQVVKIPVIGPGETSAHVASLLGKSFSILSTGPKGAKRGLSLPSLSGKLASTRGVGLSVLEAREDRDRAIKAFTDEGRIAIEEDGADTLVMGCMSLAYQDIDEELSKILHVPIVNPVKVSIRLAEMLVDIGLSHSKTAYPYPKKIYHVKLEEIE